SFTASGGSGSITVTAGAGCSWSAVGSAAWLTTSSTGAGSGTASYTVAANTATTSRTGTVTVAGQSVTVTQEAAPCTYSLSSPIASFGPSGGSGSITVTAG